MMASFLSMSDKDSLSELSDFSELGGNRSLTAQSLAASDEEREIAKQAYAKFLACDFAAAGNLTAELGLLRPKDPKVAVNSLVARFFGSRCVCGQHFMNELTETCEKVS
jgi:hypothetical protein